MKTVLVILLIFLSVPLLTACPGTLPTMEYCDKVTYTREGAKIVLHAECNAPVGNPVSLPGM